MLIKIVKINFIHSSTIQFMALYIQCSDKTEVHVDINTMSALKVLQEFYILCQGELKAIQKLHVQIYSTINMNNKNI